LQKIVALLQESGFNIFELETMQEADKKGALKPPVLLSTPETVNLPSKFPSVENRPINPL
jgi:hypothetical protein